jgi:hypothetical protein
VAPNWPKVRVIYSRSQFGTVAYGWAKRRPEPLQKYYQGEWMRKNVNLGPLLKSYPNKSGNNPLTMTKPFATRSKRSRCITLAHAATKSRTNACCESAHA